MVRVKNAKLLLGIGGMCVALFGSICLDHNKKLGIAICFAGIILLFASNIMGSKIKQ
jgi:hypothetical protein